MGKGASGLNDLFDKVFTDDRMKGTMESLHSEFSKPREEKPPVLATTKSPVKGSRPKPTIDVSTALDSHTVSPSDGVTVKLSDSATALQSDDITVQLSHSDIAAQSDLLTAKEVSNPPQTIYQTIPYDVLTLSYNQASVLEYLVGKNSNVASYMEISNATSISKPSTREAFMRLVAKGFVAPPVTIRNAAFQGFSFILNKHLCDIFVESGGLSRQNYQTRHQTGLRTVTPSDGLTVQRLDGITTFSSSINNLTTTTSPQSRPDTVPPSDLITVIPSDCQTGQRPDSQSPSTSCFVLDGPEMAYWSDAGLQERQAQKWCEEFGIEKNEMKLQLAWARYDLVANGKDDGVQNVINWIYGVFKRTAGCYPRPENYKTPIEIRLEQMKQQKEQDEKALRELEDLKLDGAIQSIIDDPDSKEYKELFSSLSALEKDLKGRALNAALRNAYKSKNARNQEG